MAVAIATIVNKRRVFENFLNKWNSTSIGDLISRITVQTGVADGGADLTKTYLKVGDLVYDQDNDDYYSCSVAATTIIKLNA